MRDRGSAAFQSRAAESPIPALPAPARWTSTLGQPTPTDPGDYTFVGLDTRTPFTVEYSGQEGGKMANYILRWINSRGEKGPWSETCSATIAA